MKDLADEVELCTGDRTTCAATQLKMILLMGVREEELVQRLVSLDSQASLDDFVTCCRTFESSRAAASAIVAAPSQLNILSSYKRNQRRQKMTAMTKHTPQRCQSPPLTKDSPASCRSCTRQHAVGHCPAKDSTCPNCGYKGHWHRTPRCPAKDSECTTCHKQGHFAKCYQLVKDTKLDMATPQEDHFQAGNDDLGDGSDDSGEPNVLESGEADVPPSLPPPLTPHPSSPSQHSPEYRLQMEQQRQLNDERFMQLLSMIAPKPLQVQQTSPEQQAPAAHQLSPVPPVATTSGSPHAPITAPVMGKPMIPSPPQLQSDVTYQLFRQWRRKFEDYSVLMGLHSLPPATQHIYLRTCVSLEVQRLLHYTLAIPPDSSMPVVQVLDALQQYFRNSQNEALRRRELLSCKQTPGEPFSAFYARMKDLADESELCTGDRTTCAATQLKMILLMGGEEELVQRLVSLDSQASLDDFVTCCRTFESSRAAASAIVAAPSQLNILSSYKGTNAARR
ncbi:hypothetical protein C7M84_017476 [Penaeus vannamei]|uniref:CCHC-type domain-containing protein n=1 Tax=Penaeus vannamei TaxID=6689 RepID=A0A423SK49_PENVA|nr:hypothetical protein C7M84_017476 [Penaeus vannamei]